MRSPPPACPWKRETNGAYQPPLLTLRLNKASTPRSPVPSNDAYHRSGRLVVASCRGAQTLKQPGSLESPVPSLSDHSGSQYDGTFRTIPNVCLAEPGSWMQHAAHIQASSSPICQTSIDQGVDQVAFSFTLPEPVWRACSGHLHAGTAGPVPGAWISFT